MPAVVYLVRARRSPDGVFSAARPDGWRADSQAPAYGWMSDLAWLSGDDETGLGAPDVRVPDRGVWDGRVPDGWVPDGGAPAGIAASRRPSG